MCIRDSGEIDLRETFAQLHEGKIVHFHFRRKPAQPASCRQRVFSVDPLVNRRAARGHRARDLVRRAFDQRIGILHVSRVFGELLERDRRFVFTAKQGTIEKLLRAVSYTHLWVCAIDWGRIGATSTSCACSATSADPRSGIIRSSMRASFGFGEK